MTYLYFGENSQERDAAVRQLLQAFIAVNGDMAVDVLDTEDCDVATAIDAVTTVPFLSPKRLVICRYASANKELTTAIDTILDRIADTTDVLFVEGRMDARSVYTKTLKKRVSEVKHFESVEGPALSEWIIAETQRLGGAIRPQSAQLLLDRVGHNQQLLHNELKKLLLVQQQIDDELIIQMTHIAPTSSVFTMLDAIVQGRVAEASKLYFEQRAQGMEPLAILGMIAWQLHILAMIVVSKHKQVDDIARSSKLNPFVVRKNMAIASRISKAQMIALLDAAIAADMRIKTGKAKPDPEVHALLLRLAEISNATL